MGDALENYLSLNLSLIRSLISGDMLTEEDSVSIFTSSSASFKTFLIKRIWLR